MQSSKFTQLLRMLVIGGNIIFVLWIAFNAMDAGWKGTIREIFSSLALIVLLCANTYFVITQLKRTH